jgi:hypothetical protein
MVGWVASGHVWKKCTHIEDGLLVFPPKFTPVIPNLYFRNTSGIYLFSFKKYFVLTISGKYRKPEIMDWFTYPSILFINLAVASVAHSWRHRRGRG